MEKDQKKPDKKQLKRKKGADQAGLKEQRESVEQQPQSPGEPSGR